MQKEILEIPAHEKEKQEIILGRKKKVAAYARVSTEKDEQFQSYEAQISYYKDYILKNPSYEYVDTYTDEGISGTSTTHREGFKKMIQDALDNKFDLIVTKSISRFARNTVDSLTTIRLLKDHNVEVFFEKENIYTFDSKGELLITIMSSLAQEESRSISENVTWGMRQAMKNGKVWVPYKNFLGYQKGEDGKLIINKEEAYIIKRIYLMFLEGYSVNDIRNVFLRLNILPPNKDKKEWYVSTIKSILQNEKYVGDSLMGKSCTVNFLTKEKVINNGESPRYFIKNNHDAIISKSIANKVKQRIKKYGFNKSFLVSGLKNPEDIVLGNLRCKECGALIGEVIWHPHTKYEKLRYRCNSKYKKSGCPLPSFTKEHVFQEFDLKLREFLRDPNHVSKMEEMIPKNIPNVDYLKQEIELLKEEYNEFPSHKEGCLARIGWINRRINGARIALNTPVQKAIYFFQNPYSLITLNHMLSLLRITIDKNGKIEVQLKNVI